MQRSIIALFAAGALSGAQALAIERTSSQSFARSWLRSHAAPQGDELAELRNENPDAYAIVKALLTKRSLGLLDPKHPSASFAAPPPSANQEEEPSGAAAFAKFAKPGEIKSAMVYSEAPATSSHDWMSWKPQDSAMDDESMVQNVLGAVAQLKGQVPAKAAPKDTTAFSADEDALESDMPAPAAPAPVEQPVAASPAAQSDNSYLKDFDLGSQPVSAPKASAIQGNSYLRGAEMAPAAPAAPVDMTKGDAMAGFSWDDSKAEQPTEAPKARLVQEQQATKKATTENVLSSWLDGAAPAAKKSQAKPTAAPASSNPYMMNW